MSYLKSRQRTHQKSRRRGLGDDATNNVMLAQQQFCSDQSNYDNFATGCRLWFPNGIPAAPPSETQQCIDEGNVITAPLDAKTLDIARNWNPPDTFTSDQIRAVTGSVLSVIRQAQLAVDKAASEPNANQSDLRQATDDLIRHGKQAIDYTAAANQADATGAAAVAAPNLKTWATSTMSAASSAIVTAYTVGCTKPWWVGALVAFQTAFDTLWGILKSIAGVVIAVGEKVIAAVEGAFGLVAWLEKWGPIAAVGLAALFIITRDKSKKLGVFGL